MQQWSPLNEWWSPLIDLMILFVVGALGGVGAMFGLGKPISLSLIGEAIFKNGAWGAGVSICVVEKVGKTMALGLSLAIGVGLVGKEQLTAWVLRMAGVNDSRNKSIPDE